MACVLTTSSDFKQLQKKYNSSTEILERAIQQWMNKNNAEEYSANNSDLQSFLNNFYKVGPSNNVYSSKQSYEDAHIVWEAKVPKGTVSLKEAKDLYSELTEKFFPTEQIIMYESSIPGEYVVNVGEPRYLSADESTQTINIYAGSGENTELSNFAIRPFISNLGKFNTVEGAFQAAKDQFTDETIDNSSITTQLHTATGAQAKVLGRKLRGLDIKAWDKVSSKIMKELISESFTQNPKALQLLLNTGKNILTHIQDRGKWGKEFPKLLMEVRSELSEKEFPTETERDEAMRKIADAFVGELGSKRLNSPYISAKKIGDKYNFVPIISEKGFINGEGIGVYDVYTAPIEL